MTEVTTKEQIQPDAATAKSGFRLDIQRAKGLGIVLVVWGHLIAASSIYSTPWYDVTKNVVYLFHMPFFLYLSGFIYFYLDMEGRAQRGMRSFIKSRAVRLLVPMLILGVAIVFIKAIAGLFIDTGQDSVGSISAGILSLIVGTEHSPAIFIWYVFCVFAYSVITPYLIRISNGRLWPWLGLFSALYFAPVPDILYANRVVQYFIFFLLGGWAARHEAKWAPLARRYFPFLALLFAVSLLLPRSVPGAMLVSGTFSMPVLHHVMRGKFLDGDRLLKYLGDYSFTIYLFNTLFIGAAFVLYTKLFGPNPIALGLVYPLLLIAGVVGPICVYLFTERVPPLRWVRKYIR